MGVCGSISLALAVLYVAYMASLIHEMVHPQACSGHGCYQALLSNQQVDLRLIVGGKEVWHTLNVSADEQLDFKVELPVPPEVRRGSVDNLTVEVFLAVHGATRPIAVARTNAVKRMLPRVHEASMLLSDMSATSTSNELPVKDVGPAAPDYDGKVPHYIYARSRLDIRIVRDWTPYASIYYQDRVLVGSSFDHQHRRYAPHWYVDSFPLLSKHAVPLSSDESRSHPSLHVRVTPISSGWHRFVTQMSAGLAHLSAISGELFDDEAFDELRELVSEDRMYRFLLMQARMCMYRCVYGCAYGCTRHARAMHTPCTHHAHTMHTPCTRHGHAHAMDMHTP